MYNIKKKRVIKTFSIFIGMALVIVGLFVCNQNKIHTAKALDLQRTNQIINNICSSLESINNSFLKAEEFDIYPQESKNICVNAYHIKLLLNFENFGQNESIKWFSDLFDYSKTDMNNLEKNKYYKNRCDEAMKIIIDICQTKSKSLNTFEEFFKKETNTSPDNMLFNLEKQYSFLQNKIYSPNKDVALYAKEILGSTFSLNRFKGNFCNPKTYSYSTQNSYINITPYGKYITIMSEDDRTQESESEYDYLSIANTFIDEYANYGVEFKNSYSITLDNLVYFFFCPTYNIQEQTVYNYDEAITIALSKNNGTLKAFNASLFLKNYPTTPTNPLPKQKDITKPDSTEIIQEQFIINSGQLFREILFDSETQNNFYCLYNDETIDYYTEYEYFLYVFTK